MCKEKIRVFFWLYFALLTGVFGGDAVKSVSVMEGDSVTLNTDTELQGDDVIEWRFGTNGPLLAKLNREFDEIYISNSTDRRFRDRLKLDDQTGSLTIMNITKADSGLYEVTIRGNKTTFTLTVYARLPAPVISRNCPSSSSSSSNCSVVCSSSVLSVCDATLSWYAGMSVLSSISVCDLSISLSLPLEVEYQDKNTYSCVLNNTISNQTTHLNITEHCYNCPAETTQSPSESPSQSPSQSSSHSPSQLSTSHSSDAESQNQMLIFAGAAAVAGSLLTVALVGIFWICKKRGKTDQEETTRTSEERKKGRKKETVRTSEDEITYADPIFYKRNVQKAEDEVVYASVVPKR